MSGDRTLGGPSDETAHPTPFAAARVGIVGLGALGHLLGLDLARAGVGHLHLVDGDEVTADTASRQYPITFAGWSKPTALRQLVRWYNPWQSTTLVRHSLGLVGRDPYADLDPSLDVLVDATAEPAVTRFLAHWAASTSTCFVSITATAGGRGGTLLRLPALTGGCYRCLEHHRAEQALPAPPELPGSWVRPPRCSEATYTGYGHDLALVAHQGSRLVLRSLAGSDTSGSDDYWVADLPDDGSPSRWTGVPLPVHPSCPHPHREAPRPQLSLWPQHEAADL